MYNGLPTAAKEKVLTNKKLVDIVYREDGVDVTCADGSTYHGSMVIGAANVHSKTRQVMRDLALQWDPSRSWDPAQPFKFSYQLLYGAFPTPSSLVWGMTSKRRIKAIMYLSGPKRAWFFLYKKRPRPTTERANYTEQDVESLAQEFADFPLTQTVKVKDVWPRMLGAGMTNLEEGIAQHYSLSRIVLFGDACHKLTTRLGLGFNNGAQDIVALYNRLRQAVPDTSTLTRVFEQYEAVRKSRSCSLVVDVANAGMETRMHAWANTMYHVLSVFQRSKLCGRHGGELCHLT